MMNLQSSNLKGSLANSRTYPLGKVLMVQKHVRGFLVRSRMRQISAAVAKIQSFYRTKQTQSSYKNLVSCVSLIQRQVRRYLLKSHQINQNLASFLHPEQIFLSNLQVLEQSELFSSPSLLQSSSTEETFKTLSAITENSAKLSNSKLISTGSLGIQLKQVSPFHLEKISFFCRPFEFTLLVDDSVIYEPFWSKQFEELNKDLVSKEEQIIDLAVGNCHSLALTSKERVFAWGWNDKFQCGSLGHRPRLVRLEKNVKVVQVSCGNDHSLMLASNGQVIAMGDNSKGQLGLGHYSEQKNPTLIEIPACKQVEAVGNQNMAVTVGGELFIWPFETFHGEKRSYPVRMLPEQVVSEVSVGFNFAVILTTAGLVYSLGSNNKAGQLGLGDTVPRHGPSLVGSLKKSGEKIAGVSCGLHHVVARSTLGKIYTWGSGSQGQLGHGGTEDELIPRAVTLTRAHTDRLKPVQVSAGCSFSLVMMENRRILWTGKNSASSSCSFVEVNLNTRMPELFKNPGEFAVVKIRSAWSRVLSIGFVIFADLRCLSNVPQNKLSLGLNLMSARWTGKSADGIEAMFLRCINR